MPCSKLLEIMGCCYSWCSGNKETQAGENSERQRLLANPVSNSTSIQHVRGDEYYGVGIETGPVLSDEQNMRKKILQEAAADMIDVGSSYQIDQQEYNERANMYARRLAMAAASGAGPPRLLRPQPPSFLLEDVPDPEPLLCSETISAQRYLLITTAAKAFSDACLDIKVTHKDDIVVPFEIPH